MFKGKKKRANAGDYFCNGETSKETARLLDICNNLWTDIYEKIETLQSNLTSQIFEDLVKYVGEAHANFSLSAESSARRKTPEIPTAALVTGVNMPDHGVMFGNLKKLIAGQVSPYMANLKSKDCINVKTTMGKLVTQVSLILFT